MTLLTLVACARTVAGTGTPPPRPAALADRMYATMTGLEHGYAATITDGPDAASGRISALASRVQGDDGAATFTLDDDECELRRVDGRNYALAGAGFWTSYRLTLAQVSQVEDVWTEFDDTVGLAQFVVVRGLVQGYSGLADSDFEGVSSGDVGGVRVWELRTGGSTLAVAAEGPPRLLRLSTGDTTIEFSFPGDDLRVSAPDDPVPYPR